MSSFANLARGGRRTNRNSLIAIGVLEIGFVSYFPPVPQRDVVLRGLPRHRRWVKYLPRTVKWLRAGNRAHPAGPRPDGRGSFRCSTPASLRDSYPRPSGLKTAAARAKDSAGALGVPPRIIYASETNLIPYSARKSRRTASKDGLGVG